MRRKYTRLVRRSEMESTTQKERRGKIRVKGDGRKIGKRRERGSQRERAGQCFFVTDDTVSMVRGDEILASGQTLVETPVFLKTKDSPFDSENKVGAYRFKDTSRTS